MHCKNQKCQLRMTCSRYTNGLQASFQEPYDIYNPKMIKKVLTCDNFIKKEA